MEVTIRTMLPNLRGSFTMEVDENETVEMFLKQFCSQQQIEYSSSFVLNTTSQESLLKSMKFSALNVQHGDLLYLTVAEPNYLPVRYHDLCIMAIILFIIGASGIVSVSILKSKDFDSPYAYGIGIDAGSSHTQLYVYRWLKSKINNTGVIDQILSCPADKAAKKMPALSEFKDRPSEAGDECVRPCLEQAKNFLPQPIQSLIPVYLGATAGMRIVELTNKTASDAIMASVQKTIYSSPFKHAPVKIIAGQDEGAYAWITVNFLLGSFGFYPSIDTRPAVAQSSHFVAPPPRSPPHTDGALDLGGASTQIAFVPSNNSTAQDLDEFNLYYRDYRVYSYSHLCFGLNEAMRQYRARLVVDQNFSSTIDDPCRPKGNVSILMSEDIFTFPCTKQMLPVKDFQVSQKFTLIGSSNSDKCRNVTRQIFNFSSSCHYPPCSFGSVESHQPAVGGNNFTAFSGFYFTMAFLNLTREHTTSTSLEDFEVAMKSFCGKSWDEVKGIKTTGSITSACFNSHFVYVILVEAYGFNSSNWASITFALNSNGTDFGWILGMMTNATSEIPPWTTIRYIEIVCFTGVLILCIGIIILSVCFAQRAILARKKKKSLITEESRSSTSSYGTLLHHPV